ncbi:hypothetical protein [Dolichospermum circinale]|uniref:hypothetical protein n=1 Tax=Dolichospermum circinale TaxID=109265 RepID=UPI00232CB544|nr:hypothetical protein [Dolichospermum circinale]MDB9452553.1 hypothetical protein [Dolichospermum circinale CS-547]
MNNKLDLYPFLISRNQYKDYGVIVAPDFLEANELSTLIQATQYERETESGTVIHCQVKYEEDHQRDFTLIFRVDTATQQDIGENTLDILRDLSNTPINLVVGVVCRGLRSESESKIRYRDLEEIRKYVRVKYREFWYNQTNRLFSSQSLDNLDTSSEFLQIRSIPEIIVKFPVREPAIGEILDDDKEQQRLLTLGWDISKITAAIFTLVIIALKLARRKK